MYGGFTLDAIDCPRITVKDGNGLLFHEVVPKTVGQYVGIADKKGVKIFEGDIVKVTYKRYTPDNNDYVLICLVDYGNGAFGLKHEGGYIFFLTPEGYLEVIGNIHDNPELLPDKGSVPVNMAKALVLAAMGA